MSLCKFFSRDLYTAVFCCGRSIALAGTVWTTSFPLQAYADGTIFVDRNEASCLTFENDLEHLQWWLDNFHASVPSLLGGSEVSSEIKLAQLLYIEEILLSSDALDRQKFLVLEAAKLTAISELLPSEDPLMGSRLVLPDYLEDSQRAIECAFEFPSGGTAQVSPEFFACAGGE